MREARLAKLQAAQLYLCTPEPLVPPGVQHRPAAAQGPGVARGAHPAAPAARERGGDRAAPSVAAGAGECERPRRRRRLRACRRPAPRAGRPAARAGPPHRRARGADRAVDPRRGPAGGRGQRTPTSTISASARCGRRPTKAGRPGVGTRLAGTGGGDGAAVRRGCAALVRHRWGRPPDARRRLGTGARRVVVVRAITQAPDPAGVAGELARRLREAAGSCVT